MRAKGLRSQERNWLGSGFVGLHLKGMLRDEFLNYLQNWLALGGTVPPCSGRLQVSKHQNTENKKTWLMQSVYLSQRWIYMFED